MTESSFIQIKGETFKCIKCNANLFHKHSTDKGIWICNGCGTEYADEYYSEGSKKGGAE